MIYFQKLLNLASYPKKSPCVLFFIVQKNLFLSPLCYHQIKLSSQMDAEHCAGKSADERPARLPSPSVSGAGGVRSPRANRELAGRCSDAALEICSKNCQNEYAGSEME